MGGQLGLGHRASTRPWAGRSSLVTSPLDDSSGSGRSEEDVAATAAVGRLASGSEGGASVFVAVAAAEEPEDHEEEVDDIQVELWEKEK